MSTTLVAATDHSPRIEKPLEVQRSIQTTKQRGGGVCVCPCAPPDHVILASHAASICLPCPWRP